MKRWFSVISVAAAVLLMAVSVSCDDGGDDGSSGTEDDSVQIDSEVESMDEFPADAEVREPESYSVNGEEITGTESTRVDDTEESPGQTSVTIPSSLSRAGETMVTFGFWFNGKMYKAGPTESFELLLSELQNTYLISEAIDDSATDKIKIDNMRLPFIEPGDQYLCFYYEDSAGNQYRTPVVIINFSYGDVDDLF